MTNTALEITKFYASQGGMSDPGKNSDLLEGLPEDMGELCRIVQQNLIHVFWAERYGRKLSEADRATLNIRTVAGKLETMRQADGLPQSAGWSLSAGRAIEQRQVGNCRDFTLLLTAILRQQGRAARARCGFATYFMPNHYEDHWVCEYWNEKQGGWVLVDAQLDDLQQEKLGLTFDALDVPREQFIVAGKAWQMCREGRAKPEQFGIFDMNGWWFIWGDVVRDFLSLNKVEILPWDYEVGFFTHPLEDPFPQDKDEVAEYDRIARLTTAGDEAFEEIRRFYSEDGRWRVPEGWMEYLPVGR